MNKRVKILLIIAIVAAIVVVGFAVMAVGFSYKPTSGEIGERFIVSNPLQLSQVEALSQYRSCAGHDFRGPTVTGKMESSPRSLKHYVKVREEFRGTMDKVAALAPFDGVVSVIESDLGRPGDQQIWLTPNSKSPRQWHFIFFHVNLDPTLKEGSPVFAGELIGTANLARGPEVPSNLEGPEVPSNLEGPEGATDNFDIAVKFTRPLHRPIFETPFYHMAEDVLAEYAKHGINAENMVIPEETRDNNPCPLLPEGEGFGGPDVYFPPEASQDAYIFLK